MLVNPILIQSKKLEYLTPSIMSQRRANRTTEEEDINLDEAIRECVRYIVCREGSKIPIKRAEILKYLSANFQTPSNQINVVISEANKALKSVYGTKLVQVEAKGGVQYIVVLTKECNFPMQSTAADPQQRKLLITALTHIFMTGGPVKEEDMWRFLEEAGLLDENDHNSRRQFISTFTKQMYLTYSKIGEGELARNVFEWGQRAMEEVPKMFILNKMAEAFDKTPDYWCEQYKEALQEAEQE